MKVVIDSRIINGVKSIAFSKGTNDILVNVYTIEDGDVLESQLKKNNIRYRRISFGPDQNLQFFIDVEWVSIFD